VLQDIGGRARAVTWRRAGLGCLVACAVVAPAAPADESPTPNPEPLWRAYPLKQNPTSTGAAAPRPRASQVRPPSSRSDAPDSGRSPIPLTAAGAAAVLLLAIALRRVGFAADPDEDVGGDRDIGVRVVGPRWQAAAGTSNETDAARPPEGARRSLPRSATTPGRAGDAGQVARARDGRDEPS
jgi:hypothetical protein